ncbi:MAG: STAS/SEC14 domain-containing protein [Micavibrio aeruginosavorus]|uniref:STAS/SEC14 domain-containing protein n=1 Tax=Micavibrio aeruginosavorus TaxID=349221 RepID=A0A7T5R2J3_9BACT|nr:MAG: STAS/SEC14 domain-containing protein [Micavibrio aeruginosavorus]
MNEKFNIIMPETTDRVLCIMVDKPVSVEGYTQNFLPRVEEMAARHGEVRLLVYFKNYQGWEEEAALLDLNMTPKLGGYVRRFAMVNPPQKLLALLNLKKPLITGKTRSFNEAELDKALAWVQEN